MDGNGRWAERQGLPRTAGHAAGARRVREIVRAAPGLGIGTLTLYAFSSDNWARPAPEVRALFALFADYLQDEIGPCQANGVRLSVIGRRDRLPLALRGAIVATERATAHGRRLWLRIAIDYSSRDQILQAVGEARDLRPLTRERFGALLTRAGRTRRPAPDVDLLIRAGGERRLSDFLLWESAYAELCFSDKAWPDFDGDDLAAAVADFRQRERRYGGLGARSAGAGDAPV
jgi:undecaprenyl diphosphate synthase